MDVETLLAEIREAWRPPPKLTLSQWADRYAVLSKESSAEAGRWRTIPYQRGMLDAMTDRHYERVTVMKSARVGYTKCLNHLTGYHVHYDPCPIMHVQPTVGDAERYSRSELAPMIRDTPVLTPLFPEPGRRESGNTILRKQFPGGEIILVGAESARGFRGATIRVLQMDEIDGYAKTGAGDEGDQIRLAIMRTDTFWNRKLIFGSTPTLEATSRIKRMFELGDQRRYFVPCPECKKPQVLEWENLRWPKNEPDKAAFMCVHCGVLIEYRWQRWMVEEADRLQREGEPGYGWVPTNPNPEPRHASFHIWAAYSYSPNATWAQLAREWLACHKNNLERVAFVNTVLGLPFKGDGDAPEWQRLYERRLPYKIGTVPEGGVLLVAGVDVQQGRLEVEIVAYGPRLQSWSVDYRVLAGDTSQLDGPDSPYRKLDDLLNETFPHAAGGPGLQIRRLAIDSGYQTNTVYQWVRRHPLTRVMAVDGRDSYQMIVGAPKSVEVTVQGKRKGRSVRLWPVGTSLVKTELYGWLKQVKTEASSGDDIPYGYCNFPEYPEEYFKGLTAEEIVPRLVRGFRRYQWEKVYPRNEPLDCRVYARAAAFLEGADRWDSDQWRRLEAELGIGKAEAKPAERLVVQRKITRAKDPFLN